MQLISEPLTLNNFDHLVSGNRKGQEHSHDSLEIETRVHCKYINRNKFNNQMSMNIFRDMSTSRWYSSISELSQTYTDISIGILITDNFIVDTGAWVLVPEYSMCISPFGSSDKSIYHYTHQLIQMHSCCMSDRISYFIGSGFVCLGTKQERVINRAEGILLRNVAVGRRCFSVGICFNCI